MTNHSHSKAAVALDPTDSFDHLAGVLGGRLIDHSELVYVDRLELGSCTPGVHGMPPRTDAEED